MELPFLDFKRRRVPPGTSRQEFLDDLNSREECAKRDAALVDGLGSVDGAIQLGELRGRRCGDLAVGPASAEKLFARARQALLDSARNKVSLPVKLDLRVSLGHAYRAMASHL